MTPERHDPRYTRAIRALFTGERPPRIPAALGEHMRGCAACRALADQLSAAEGLLAEALEVEVSVAPFEASLVWEGLRRDLQLPPSEPRPTWRAVWALGLAGLVLFMSLVAGLLFFGPIEGPKEFQVRGPGATAQLELFCIRQGPSHKARSARQADGSFRCRLDESLGFAVMSASERPVHLALFGLDPAGEPLWYTPTPHDSASLFFAPGQRPQALERTVRLSVNHLPGTTRIWALFSHEPLGFDRVRLLAQTVSRGGVLPAGITARQDSLEILGEHR